MKVCACCKEEKPLDMFHKKATNKDGLYAYCKPCKKIKDKESYERHKEKRYAVTKLWQANNKEKYRKHQSEWDKRNTQKRRAWEEANRETINARKREWKKANKAKVNASTRNRQARQLQATPPWFSKEDVQYYYNLAEYFTWLSGGFVKYHVDHVVPLRGKNVCGLHVQNNLQVINSVANLRKSNKHVSNI